MREVYNGTLAGHIQGQAAALVGAHKIWSLDLRAIFTGPSSSRRWPSGLFIVAFAGCLYRLSAYHLICCFFDLQCFIPVSAVAALASVQELPQTNLGFR